MPRRNFETALTSRSVALMLSILMFLLLIPEAHPQRGVLPFSDAIDTKAAPDRIYDIESWRFTLGRFSYKIDQNGKAERRDGRNRPFRFRVDLEGSDGMVRLYFAEFKGDLLLLCEDKTFDAGAGFVARLDRDTLKEKWRAHIPVFNIAKGLIEGNSAYLGAVGFAAKLNLDTGRFVWKHDDFYRKYREDGAFNVFDPPKIVGNEVIYVENQEMYNKKPNVIRFNKNNGQVPKVELN